MMYFAFICRMEYEPSKQAVEGSNPSAITNNYRAYKKLGAFLVLQKAQKRLTFFKTDRAFRHGYIAGCYINW